MKFLRDHSLSLVIAAMWLALTLVAAAPLPQWWQDYFQGLAHDTFGALVIVIATKYFIEKGSTQSK